MGRFPWRDGGGGGGVRVWFAVLKIRPAELVDGRPVVEGRSLAHERGRRAAPGR